MTEPARPLGVVSPTDVTEPAGSVLDLLRADLQREVEDDLVTLPVPGRPAYMVRYSAKVPYDRFSAWLKRSEDKSVIGGINLLRFGGIVLANCCRGILRDGEEITAADGPLTFTSKALWEILGVSDAVGAVNAFYGNDAHVIASGTEVIATAGYGDQINADSDPTSR